MRKALELGIHVLDENICVYQYNFWKHLQRATFDFYFFSQTNSTDFPGAYSDDTFDDKWDLKKFSEVGIAL